MMNRAAFYTLGCKVNQYDTESMMGLFRNADYDIVDFEEEAEVYVINTCTVTHQGDRKSRQMIRRARRRNPQALVVVTGCYAQTAPGEILGIAGVNIVLGNQDKEHVVELVNRARQADEPICQVSNIMKVNEFRQSSIGDFIGRTRASVKIQDGCNEYCSYCIIPFARGPQRSRRPGDVIQEVQHLAAQGFKEVVLTGIHLSSYGRDLYDQLDLATIVERIHEINGLERIRISSLEPMGLTTDMLERLAALPKVCHHLHLPLQVGSDAVLQRMQRNYTTAQYRELVAAARELMPGVNVSTDVMVGFPGETAQLFQEGLDFVRNMEFGRIHVFPYSSRKGTRAHYLDGHVNSREKNRRTQAMLDVASDSMQAFHRRFLGEELPVLVEGERDASSGLLHGLTDNYIRVLFPGEDALSGSLVNVKLRELRVDAVVGERTDDNLRRRATAV